MSDRINKNRLDNKVASEKPTRDCRVYRFGVEARAGRIPILRERDEIKHKDKRVASERPVIALAFRSSLDAFLTVQFVFIISRRR